MSVRLLFFSRYSHLCYRCEVIQRTDAVLKLVVADSLVRDEMELTMFFPTDYG